jgi:hypothetical protein
VDTVGQMAVHPIGSCWNSVRCSWLPACTWRRAEAVNAQRFAELYASIPDVFVPKIYTNLSTRKVLVMEW